MERARRERESRKDLCNCSDRIERASMPVRLNPSTSSANFTTVLDAEKSKTAVYGEINVESRPMPSHGAVDTSTGSTKVLLQFVFSTCLDHGNAWHTDGILMAVA